MLHRATHRQPVKRPPFFRCSYRNRYGALAAIWLVSVLLWRTALFHNDDDDGAASENKTAPLFNGQNDVMVTVFVGLSSYRDDECYQTILHAFEKAKFPDSLFIGAFQQHSENDTDCFYFSETCRRDPKHPICGRESHVQVMKIHWREAKGPVWGRAKTEELLGDQDFYLQVDSHTRFINHWDKVLSDMWTSIGNEYAVVSSYPKALSSYGRRSSTICVICRTGWKKASHHMIKHEACRIITPPPKMKGKPVLTPFWGAGMSFSRSHRVRRVPYDPYLPMLFDGEEFSIGCRMWTHGYDFYAPSQDVVFHQYGPNTNGKPRAKYWDIDWPVRAGIMGQSAMRVNYMLGMKQWIIERDVDKREIEKYSLGTKRTLEQYLEWAGLDLRNKTSRDMCPIVSAGELQTVEWDQGGRIK